MNGDPEDPIREKQEDDGDDARDTDGPRIYGEELEPHECEPEFIVGPPPDCETRVIPVPAFRGDFCYIVFPGSRWETTSPAGTLVEAQTFFAKYCMYFNFLERTLPADDATDYEEWYARWKGRVRRSIVPDRHIPGLRRRIIAQNPGLSPERVERRVADEIRRIVRNASIPGPLHEQFYRKMKDLQEEVARGDCQRTLIVFIDEYICYNPKPTRTSACQLRFNQIGITAVDAGSPNVLAHEMVHLLGKPRPNRGGKVTWEHERCPDSVLRTTRRNWWRTYTFADLLSSAAYQEIIRNQNRATIRLIDRIA